MRLPSWSRHYAQGERGCASGPTPGEEAREQRTHAAPRSPRRARRDILSLDQSLQDGRPLYSCTSKSKYWLPAKRYGWGWGVPCAWQGWCVLIAHVQRQLELRGNDN
jgi:hypothetical protein